ncbi:OLC1v1010072C1 [Oldenlandia corymbosa var. corymbosa]|uniref:OLC1v1010072C1 n=1 Tax=Oldenlandia corymbosa var. corymbosa TaxID=529605 RepID=A0AAV1DQH6_OLDCO|nr:OLC1v1010072C1 [Oldenlandia corymbosa var. corymbosa]
MRGANLIHIFFGVLALWSSASCVKAEDPYRFFTWEITYGNIAPLGVTQKGILINGQFPGPTITAVTNDNVYVNVVNKLDEPFLLTWHGIKQRRQSWQDGVLGTNCPIPPGANWTYKMQMKDQIGTYNYYPSTSLHRVAGAYGGLNIYARSVIAIPYPIPVADFTMIVSDWWNKEHKVLKNLLDTSKPLPSPNGLLINGKPSGTIFTGTPGKRYMLRVSNLCVSRSINIGMQGHNMTLVEVEGSHTIQQKYNTFDIHMGQSATFLITLDNQVRDYGIRVSSRFIKPILNATAVLRYAGSQNQVSGPYPSPPSDYHWSMLQARTIKWNLTANAARPNPQGSYHYGMIPIVRTIVLANAPAQINGQTRYTLNGISYENPTTPLKLADYFNIPGVFVMNGIKDSPSGVTPTEGVSVFGFTLHDFVEIVFQNNEKVLQSYHLDGYDFWTVGFANGVWNPSLRNRYNLDDAPTRNTVQVYPMGWSAILIPFDNKGMWNLRSQDWARRYLGQELYIRVWNTEQSLYTEANIPDNAILCGKAKQ